MAIPRKIHYFWFGNNEKGELEKKCIASWRKFCPDCEIIEWNETNYDVTKNVYMNQAFQEKRWGFVSDYARLDVIYQYGGIYLDTDVEIIKSYDSLFEGEGFIGFEKIVDNHNFYKVNTGQGFGAPPGDAIIKKMKDVYDKIQFMNPDGTLNLETCPNYNTMALVEAGLRQENALQKVGTVTVYPTEYFCPIDWKNRKCEITNNTFSIHHFQASWLSESEKKRRKRERLKDHIIHIPNRCLMKMLGQTKYDTIKKKIKDRRK